MGIKSFSFLLLFFCIYGLWAQTLTVKKGVILDSLPVNDTIPETFSLYLPTDFKTDQTWPVLYVFDLDGNSKRALSMFVNAAEEEGYVIAASNDLSDTTSVTNKILKTGRLMAQVENLFPVDIKRVYTAGFSEGGRFAGLVPIFIKNVAGVISCGANFSNVELLSAKNRFHFIGIVGREDFAYRDLQATEKILNKLKFPNNLMVFDGGNQWPKPDELQRALRLFKLIKIPKGSLPVDTVLLQKTYKDDQRYLKGLKDTGRLLLADHLMNDMLSVYRLHIDTDSLTQARKELRKQKLFRAKKRSENAAFFQESLLREDYLYYLDEDVVTHNFNNLGWWNYQMGELEKFVKSSDVYKKQMGKRMQHFVNTIIDETIELVGAEKEVDTDAQLLLYMLKTITEPEAFSNYLKVISFSAKEEDYGTALFYLEELLKKGFTDKQKLYDLEHTALLRISPEFNELVSKYLKEARYEVIEE